MGHYNSYCMLWGMPMHPRKSTQLVCILFIVPDDDDDWLQIINTITNTEWHLKIIQ